MGIWGTKIDVLFCYSVIFGEKNEEKCKKNEENRGDWFLVSVWCSNFAAGKLQSEVNRRCNLLPKDETKYKLKIYELWKKENTLIIWAN